MVLVPEGHRKDTESKGIVHQCRSAVGYEQWESRAGMQECRNARMQECKNARMQLVTPVQECSQSDWDGS